MSNSIIDYQLITDWRRAVELGDDESQKVAETILLASLTLE
jgi:hypothetical protein